MTIRLCSLSADNSLSFTHAVTARWVYRVSNSMDTIQSCSRWALMGLVRLWALLLTLQKPILPWSALPWGLYSSPSRPLSPNYTTFFQPCSEIQVRKRRRIVGRFLVIDDVFKATQIALIVTPKKRDSITQQGIRKVEDMRRKRSFVQLAPACLRRAPKQIRHSNPAIDRRLANLKQLRSHPTAATLVNEIHRASQGSTL